MPKMVPRLSLPAMTSARPMPGSGCDNCCVTEVSQWPRIELTSSLCRR